MQQSLTNEGMTPPRAPTHYDLLQVPPDASDETITAAYEKQRNLYDESAASALGAEFAGIAEERRAALDEAYGILSAPRRRRAYDREIGLAGEPGTTRTAASRREVYFAIGGAVLGLLILVTLWSVMGRDTSSGPAVSEVSYAAPPIKLRTLDGGTFDLAEHRGKVVLVNFWATWCEPCKEETPDLQAAYQRLADKGLVIVGVDLFDGERLQGQTEGDVRAFTDLYGVTYPIALDDTGDVARAYKLYPIPVSYFIDREGNVRYIRIGGLTTADVEELFGRL